MAALDHAFFYNSVNGDRVYDADSFEYLLKKFFESGVFTGSCQVTAAGSGMTCSMAGGYANCDGKVRFFSAPVNLTVSNAHATYDRVDTVVVERNDTDRDITCKIVTGDYSANPTAKAPVRSGGVYQLVVAEIYVAAGTVRITQSMISDKRTDPAVCGYVTSAVSSPDFSELYAQFTAQFSAWFDEMKGQLSTDAAGAIQLEIDGLKSRASALETNKLDSSKIVYSASEPVSPAVGTIWLKPKS